MTNRILKAKHWQIFSISIVIPIIVQIVFMAMVFADISSHKHLDPQNFFSNFKFFPLILLLNMALHFGWFWSVGMGLQSKVPYNITMKVKKFKLFFGLLILLSLISVGLMYFAIDHFLFDIKKPDVATFGLIFLFIFPVQIASMFAIVYTIYFTAKTIKTVELQRAVTFSEFIAEFFLIWFFIVGVWILQPRINKIMEQ